MRILFGQCFAVLAIIFWAAVLTRLHVREALLMSVTATANWWCVKRRELCRQQAGEADAATKRPSRQRARLSSLRLDEPYPMQLTVRRRNTDTPELRAEDPNKLHYEAMRALASSAGSVAFYNNKVPSAVRSAMQDSWTYYMLGYYAPKVKRHCSGGH